MHGNCEVFISRLSEQTAQRLMESSSLSLATINRDEHDRKRLTMECPFCEKENNFSPSYWLNHIRTHTGEYSNECFRCGKISLNSTHCGYATLKETFDLHVDGLMAFVCRICNYVQINEQRIRSHLEVHHDIMQPNDNDYQMITICPPVNSIRSHSGFQHFHAQGMYILRMNRKPSPKHFTSSNFCGQIRKGVSSLS